MFTNFNPNRENQTMGANKLKINITLFSIIFMGFCQIFGQSENSEDSSSLVTLLGPENLQYVSQVQQINLPPTTSNSIFIQQIGSNNTSSLHIQAENKEINLVQNGNTNNATIDVTAKTISHNLLQNGNNNFLLEYGNTPNLDLERNIIQNGNDQGVVIFGSNSLTDNIILNLQGSSKTITIRNFN